jgi:hypothetical protein
MTEAGSIQQLIMEINEFLQTKRYTWVYIFSMSHPFLQTKRESFLFYMDRVGSADKKVFAANFCKQKDDSQLIRGSAEAFTFDSHTNHHD